MQGDTGASGSISGHCPAVYSFDKDIYPGYGTFDYHLHCFGFIGCYGYIPDHSCHRHSGRRNNLPVTIQYAGDVVSHLLQRQKISYTVKLACETLRFVGNNYDQDIIAGSHFEKLRIYISSCLRSAQQDVFIHIQPHATGRAAEYDKPHGVYLLLLFHIPIIHQVDAKLRPGSMGRQLISHISFSTT
jgi:hypothetical protein